MAVRRRYTGLAAAGLATVLTLSLSGCARSHEVTLKLVAADYGDSSANSTTHYWAAVTKAFEAKHPGIRVDVSVYDWKDVDRKVAEMVAAGKAPDMAQAGAYADYAAEGRLYSADELLSIPVQADFTESLAEAGEFRRTQYGMPFAASTRRLFYNKKLFSQAGIDGPPKTWDDVKHDAQLLKAHGVNTPYALPLGPEETQAETLMWMLSGGGSYTDTIGKYAVDSPENIRTFTWLRDNLVRPGLTNDDPGATNRQDAFDAFSAGQVGMLNGHPALIQQAKAKGVDYGTADLPGKDGPARSTLGVCDWMMAFKQPGHRGQVGTFLDYVYDRANVMSFSGEYGLLPVTVSASRDMSADPEYASLHGFLKSLPSAEFYPANKTSWPMVSKMVKSRMGAAVGPDGDPESTLVAIQKAAETADH